MRDGTTNLSVGKRMGGGSEGLREKEGQRGGLRLEPNLVEVVEGLLPTSGDPLTT